ncbi:MAG TPA: response regulator [Candidatus Acidoferrum sp.]|nr:response regulator [Candidatus Acidoferrum sp.]
MRWSQDLSIRKKLLGIVMIACGTALVLVAVLFTLYDRATFLREKTQDLIAAASMIGSNSTAALSSHDIRLAREVLNALQAKQHVVSACIYDSDGTVFAKYSRSLTHVDYPSPPTTQQDGPKIVARRMILFQDIVLNDDRIGKIYIEADLEDLDDRLRRFVLIDLFVLSGSLAVAFLLSYRLQRLISEPIRELTETAAGLSAHENYSIRVTKRSNDDIGILVGSFNQMLERIQERDGALKSAKDQLELRVQERTEELQAEVTERERAEMEMRRAKDAAEEASRAKGEFLANMSHEIRTPLNGVMGMTGLALETELTSEQREYLETVKTSADSLLTVINDILDFSKIEAGKIDLEAIDFDLRDCIEGTLKTLAFRADEKGLELLCEIATDVPEVVRGDSIRLRQVLINLVGNAVKFTDEGEVALKIQVETAYGEDRILHFIVSDTGIGIPSEKQKHIFDPFSQADSSTTRKYGGTGLGLSISAHLVEMMRGRMWVESEIGRGTQFHFTVRLGVTDSRPVEVGTASPPEILRGTRVLVVDDNRTNRRILEGMLKRWEMRSTSAASGDEALAQLSSAHQAGDPYALILTDMHMPKMDGFRLIEQIRQRSELSTAIIMMLTSAGHRGDAARCNELGVAAYLLKPIRQSELREAIARALGAVQQKGAIPLITRYSLQDARDPSAILRVLLAEDNAVNQRLAARLLEKRGHRVTVTANGREALDALEKGAYDLVLMDLQMPEMDGFQTTAAIREREKDNGTHLHVVALTAHAMKGDRERCLAAGMDGYLSKPIRPTELDELLESCLVRRAETVQALETSKQSK